MSHVIDGLNEEFYLIIVYNDCEETIDEFYEEPEKETIEEIYNNIKNTMTDEELEKFQYLKIEKRYTKRWG